MRLLWSCSHPWPRRITGRRGPCARDPWLATSLARSRMTLACFQVASSCILPSIMAAPVPSGMASTMRLANATSCGSRLNTRLAMSIWLGCSVQAPTQPCRKALRNCASQAARVGEVAERAVERLDAVGDAGIDHARQRVVPQVLLEERARARPPGPDRRGCRRPDGRRRRASSSCRARRRDRPAPGSCRACAGWRRRWPRRC